MLKDVKLISSYIIIQRLYIIKNDIVFLDLIEI